MDAGTADRAKLVTALDMTMFMSSSTNAEKAHVLIVGIIESAWPDKIVTANLIATMLCESMANAKEFLHRPRVVGAIEEFQVVPEGETEPVTAYRLRESYDDDAFREGR